MIKTDVKYFCDRCEKDVTGEYSGEITILIRDDDFEDIQPEGKMFCRDCMLSFNEWMKRGKPNE